MRQTRRVGAAPDPMHSGGAGSADATRERTATRHRPLIALAFACILGALALIGVPASAQGPVSTVLVFHDGPDPVTDAGIAAIEDLGAANEFDVVPSDDPAQFAAPTLEQYAAVIFLGVEGSPLGPSQLSGLQNYVQAGHGFLGIGTSATAHPGSAFFDGLIGARPADPCPPEPEPGEICSPTGELEQVLASGDRVHPATAGLPLELTRTDQWYRWDNRPTGQVHTVARWHEPDDPAGDGTAVGGTDWPISWCRDFQGGRSFYTGMGRTAGSYSEPAFQQHLLGAIQWSAGLLRANCKATIAANYEGERVVEAGPESQGITFSGESHGLSIAPNGWVIYIGRGDCRTDAQRGQIAGLPGPTPRILDFADPNVGIGCGNVHIFDPAEHDGTVNSGVELAGIVPVYGDRGGGGERNGKIEAGMLGVTVAPDFTETGHVYLQYFPTLNPDNPNHPGHADGNEIRRHKLTRGRVSRFTIDLETKELLLDSEVVIFEYPSQIYSCCHRGGGMGWDSEGNLYVTTGDSNSSEGTDGYSGNNPPPKCPQRTPIPGPGAPANNTDCGELNFSYQDARRTAGSTNDYNGKMLRFNPIDEIADGTQPEIGVGTTYTLPDADSPNGPNLFSGTEGTGDQAKPEIYAMGLRNPSRLAIDPETDIPYSAWVGPDAGVPNQQQGPSTYESAGQLAQAGNYGWPYCMGNQQAYRDRLADGTLRAANAAGYVSGGAAGAPIQGFYDCDNLVNDSPNNTGLTVLPHATGTGMDAGTARPLNLWYSRGNPGGANGCPEFPRQQGAQGAPNYGAPPTPLCPYLIASGATVFTGPVYRYPDTADPAVAFPEYWDGRWFLQDFGNNSAKHGLLLDPATDQSGGQPVYADSLRNGGLALNWTGSYMDSKFAPDGSYYVQTYDGFFTTGPNAGLWRFTYTGGPDTPGADPQWRATGNPLEVQFELGASGGVAYEWDFGDGESSTEPNPVHTYAEDGPYEVTLTVTYADEATDSATITVNPQGGDTVAPVTTIQLDGADPVPTYDGPVEVTLAAADNDGGSGVELTQYRVDGGAFTDYAAPFTVSGDGEHTVEYRSRDAAGNVEETKSVTFEIETGGGGGGDCLPQSDEFDGTALDPKWDVLRPGPAGSLDVAGGALRIQTLPGDMSPSENSAQNVVLTDAPDGPWTLTTRIDVSALDQLTDQAGLMVWRGEDPNNFAKVVYLSLGASGEFWIERSNAVDGSGEGQGNGNTGNLPSGPTVIFLRITSDGSTPNPTLTAHYSLDGATWSDVQAPFEPGGEGQLRIGLTSFQSVSPGGSARHAAFDWLRLHADADPGGPVDCAPPSSCLTQSDEFDGTGLDPKWDVLRPTGEVTVSDGRLSIPIGPGDWIANDPLASDALLQDAPSGEWTATASLDTTQIGFNGQAGLVLWKSENPNTFSKIVVIQSENNRFEHIVTQDGGVDPPISESITPAPGGQLPDQVLLRVRYDGSDAVAEFSADNGQSWTLIGQEGHAAPLEAPLRIGLTAFGGGGTASFDWFRVHAGSDPGGPIDCGGGGDSCDQFDGTELDPKWELVNPVPASPPTVSDGHLNLPIIPGDLFGGNGTAQMLLQGVPTDDSWVVTAKIAHANIDTNGEAAGLALVNRFAPNHFAKTALQYKTDTDPEEPGDQPGVWAERVLTAADQAVTLPPETVPFPNSGALDFEGDYGWVRFVHDAATQEIGTWTSIDGETFVNFGQNMPVDEYLSEPGGLRAGVFAKHDGSGDDVVQIDAFNVVLGSADPQTPPDECDATGGDVTPPTTTASTDPAEPDGENGWFTSPVEVTLAATDNEGGSGVDATEYSIDGGAFQPYTAPFTIEDDGDHTVSYRSTDVDGNLEATKSLELRIDTSAPVTEATVEGNEVTLEADDGPEGSGVALTEFRIDGGEWQTYVSEETILGSAADLEAWAQAGPGGLVWIDAEGGFARTQGGLGMPWYPVKEYGDFSLKLEWRDSSTGTAGNSGVFVRFPDPRIPLADRPIDGPGDWDGTYCGRTGAAATQPAWVAIYCGQEIQINDHQSDTQKTGSIYNFAPVEDPDHLPQPRGTWVDYEIRVEGQQYTVLRNGTVLNEFDNSIPLESSRAGDPPTDARQFESGYIGLQNHGTPDVIDFRNVRVLPLDEGSVEGPIVVGPGRHTVEFRSTDAAGNVEEIRSLIVGGRARLDGSVTPRRDSVKPGKQARFSFRVRNDGDAAARNLELCVKAPKQKVNIVGKACRRAGSLAPDRSARERFTLKPKRSAAGDRITLRFNATARNADKEGATATLKVKRDRRR